MTTTAGQLPVTDLGVVLGVWAHPDDECYLMAGTAMLAAASGSQVACLTATVGEAGETADEAQWPRAQLGTIRRHELADCLGVLGIDDHTWLDLPDGGLQEVDPRRGVELVSQVVERLQPDTILTFGPDGMTGHPDHVAIGTWAIEAAARVMGPSCRVLLATKTPGWARRFADVNQMLEIEPPTVTGDRLSLHVALDGRLLDRKIEALSAQASQTSALASSMGHDTYRAWVADEFWTPATG